MKKILVLMIAVLCIAFTGFAQLPSKIHIVENPAVIFTMVTATAPTTCGGTNGSAAVTASPAPVTYLWSNGSTSASLSGLSANTYTVTATNITTACKADTTVSLGSITPPVVTIQPISQNICAGNPLVLISEATNATSYQWQRNYIDIPGATSATYTVPVTTANDAGSYKCFAYSGACTDVSNLAYIIIKPIPVVNLANQTVPYTNPTATFTATGGGTYAWSTGATTASITVNTAGQYIVTVTTNGCSTIDTASLTVNGGPLAVSVSANPATICTGGSTQLNTVAINGTPPYTYIWNNSFTTINQMVSPTAPTTTYTVTVTDALGATQTGSVDVFVDTPPTANAGMDHQINITDTTIIGTPAIAGCTYLWSNGSTIANPEVWPVVTTTYTVTVTSAGGCSSTDQIQVTVAGGPFILVDPITSSAGTNLTLGQSTQLAVLVSGGTPPYAYSWSSVPVGFTSSIYNPWETPPAGTPTYTVSINDAMGLVLTAQITLVVTVPNPPTANVGYNTQNGTICAGDSTSFVINGSGVMPVDVVYNDGTNNITISNIMSFPYIAWVHPTTTTQYLLVSVMDSLNQTVNVGGGFTITVTPSPIVNLGADHAVCSGTSVVLADQSGGNYSIYQWSNGGSNSQTMVNPTATTTYVLTAINAPSMCSSSDTVVVNVNPLPIINAGLDQAMCAGDSVTLTATGAVSYNWMPGNALATSITVSPTAIFTAYTVTGFSNFGCPGTDIVNVIVNPLPVAEAGADQTICMGNSATLNATGGGTYVWSTTPNQTTASITVSPTVLTVYTVTVTSPQGCSATDIVGIIVSSYPTLNAGNDTSICKGKSVIFNINSTGATSYTWMPATGLDNANITNPTSTPTASITYTVAASNAAGCISYDNITIHINQLPVVTTNDVYACEGAPIQLNSSASISGCVFEYLPAIGLSNANIANPIATLSSDATYNVMATSSAGCVGISQMTAHVTLLPVADFSAFVYNDMSGRVEYANTSSNATSYNWNFGDGNTSILDNPIHTYIANGNYNVWLTATNNCGSDSISHIVSGITIGIEEIPAEAANINIFPNPVIDIVNVTGVENIESFRVVNTIGQIVYEQKVLGNETTVSFDASQYPMGMYTISFTTNKGNIFPKVIVKQQ